MDKNYLEGLLNGLSDATLEFSNFNEYGFDYLDGFLGKYDTYFVRLEYVDSDIEYKDESEFDDKFEYNKFCEEMGDIVISKGVKLKNKIKEILKKYTLGIHLTELEWDPSDYPCIYIGFKLNSR